MLYNDLIIGGYYRFAFSDEIFEVVSKHDDFFCLFGCTDQIYYDLSPFFARFFIPARISNE